MRWIRCRILLSCRRPADCGPESGGGTLSCRLAAAPDLGEDSMRALVYRGPGEIGVEDRPDPQPGPDEVLLEITATGICGSDLHGYTGENKRRHPGQVMGHETVGRIAAIGSNVSDESLRLGRVATVNPVIGCGECAQCAAGSEQLCARR